MNFFLRCILTGVNLFKKYSLHRTKIFNGRGQNNHWAAEGARQWQWGEGNRKNFGRNSEGERKLGAGQDHKAGQNQLYKTLWTHQGNWMQAKQAVQKREGPIRPDWGAKEDRLNGRFWKANDTAKNRVCIHGQYFWRKDEGVIGKRDTYLRQEQSQ